LVAYVAFEIFKFDHSQLAIYDLVNLDVKQFSLDKTTFTDKVQFVWDQLIEKGEKGDAFILERYKTMTIEQIIEEGVSNLGVYHDRKPLKFENDLLKSQSFKLLYFYHNRVTHYNLNLELTPKVEKLLTFE
jgi:glycerol-3-phosphate O-acyltransferase